jgi:hypothetical protein
MSSLRCAWLITHDAAPKSLSSAQQEGFISDLLNFAGWLLSNSFITSTLHSSLLRLATPPSNTTTSNELQAIVRSNSRNREDRATIMLSEYCAFGKERYKKYWDEEIPPLEGIFSILCVSASFILLDDCALGASLALHVCWLTFRQRPSRNTSTGLCRAKFAQQVVSIRY